mgnify:FL=1
MRLFAKKLICIFLLISFVFSLIPLTVLSQTTIVLPAPQQLSIAMQNNLPRIEVGQDGTITIYFSWQYSYSDFDYFELYLGDDPNKFSYVYTIYKNADPNLSVTNNQNYVYKVQGLPNGQKIPSGTIFYAKIRAVRVLQDQTGNIVDYSPYSNTIVFLTPIFVEATTASETSIDIVWDDVYYAGKRIDYDIYVSKDISFTTPTKYQIDGDKITLLQSQKPGGRVEILPNRKLKYTATNLAPSSLYYVKILPRNLPSEVIWRDPQTYTPSNPKVIGEAATYIQAEAQRIADNVVWLKWAKVSIAEGKDYEIYKGSKDQVPTLLGTVSTNEFFAMVSITEDVFFRIQVDVIDAFGRKVSIRSNDLYVHPYTLPYAPPAVEDLTAFPKSQDTITLKFKIPSDKEVVYDFYYKKYIDTNSDFTLYVSNYQMKDSDIEKDANNIPTEYYKFDITGLEKNTVYVLKVVVKKRFFDYESGTYIYKESTPALAISYTLSGDIAPPTIPTSLSVVYSTYDSVTLSWTPIYITGTQPPVINQSISYEVNFAVYQDGMDITRPENLDLTNFQRIVLSNPQIDSSGKITFKVGNLNPDTRYVFFIRAIRRIDNKDYYSLPSNVVMATTLAKYEVPVPSSPPIVENLSVVATTYNTITLSWQYIENVYFEIQISEDIKNSSGWKTISDNFKPSIKEIDYQAGICYFTAKDLKPDTLYYFRVRAYIIKDNQRIYSDYSSPVFGKTQKMPPPKTPIAFGIKDYGKDYVVFVWELAETGRKYMIEVADNISFTNSQKYTTDVDATEYKVEKLKPNTRYYARLFAIGSDGQMSQATDIISFVTKKDVSEYTGVFEPIEDTTAPTVITEDVSNKTMIIEITYKYVNGTLDSKPVVIDFTKRANYDISQFVLKIRYDVLSALVRLNKSCQVILDEANAEFDFSSLNVDELKKLSISNFSPSNVYVQLSFVKSSSKFNIPNAISEIYDIKFLGMTSTQQIGVSSFNSPISFSILNREPWSTVVPYVFDPLIMNWKLPSSYKLSNNNKNVSFILKYPQAVVLTRKGFYNDIVQSSYASKLYYLFQTIPSDDQSSSIGIKNPVGKLELASFLVYFAEKKRLYRFEVIKEYVEKAYKAGLINNVDDNSYLTKEAAVDMLIKFYEIYTGDKIAVEDVAWNKIGVDDAYIDSIKKAYKMGWLFDYVTFNPKETATREYVLAVFYHIVSKITGK